MKQSRSTSWVIWHMIPITLAFFAMGAVDTVGIGTNYVKQDFGLSNTLAGLFTSMVFFWFFVGSVPTGMLMNKIGRRKTVLWSLAVTLAALVLPLIRYNLPVMVVSFSLLGIGNTMMQVSVNPLLSNVVSQQKLSSAVSFGQFVKVVAAFSGPLIAGWCALYFGNWRLLFAFFLIISAAAFLAIGADKIKEDEITGRVSGFKENISLLRHKVILLSFAAIMCHVGIDVSINVAAPKIMMEKLALSLSSAGLAASVYFLFRILGSLLGTFILAKYPMRRFYLVSTALLAAGLTGLLAFDEMDMLYASMALIGFGNANIFSMVFSQALLAMPDKKNEISGLMVMGICGGALLPVLSGAAADIAATQDGAVAVMGICALYLIAMVRCIRK